MPNYDFLLEHRLKELNSELAYRHTCCMSLFEQMLKKFLAVSGGIDSVVMLYLMRNDESVVVLHFDHGIRPSSAEDCEFVKRLAKQYGLPFISEQAKLGEDCSEERARKERYAFFKAQLKEHCRLGGKHNKCRGGERVLYSISTPCHMRELQHREHHRSTHHRGRSTCHSGINPNGSHRRHHTPQLPMP